MIDLNQAEIGFALDAVRRAAVLVRQIQGEKAAGALSKEDRSPVTVADFASQALVGCLLSRAFPGDPLVAEEDSSALREQSSRPILGQVTAFVARWLPEASPEAVCGWIDRGGGKPQERFWTLDPIDGTKGFLRGDQYAVALALVEGGQVQIGVLGCPNLRQAHTPAHDGPGSLVVAARGQGTWLTALERQEGLTPLRVSSVADPAQARVLRSFEAGHTNAGQVDDFGRALGVAAKPLRLDSQAKYALLAAGAGELMVRLLSPARLDYREKIWDQAAGSIIVEEAGGQVTDLHGAPLDFTTGRTLKNNRGVLASNGHLHAQALAALTAIGV